MPDRPAYRGRYKPFRSDGCSLVRWLRPAMARRLFDLCFVHDGGEPSALPKPGHEAEPQVPDRRRARGTYYRGGTALERFKRDSEFALGVARREGAFWGRLWFLAVSLGGHPRLPFPWRWGFGRRDGGRRYDPPAASAERE